MFAQSSNTNSPYRAAGQPGLFATPQTSSPFSQPQAQGSAGGFGGYNSGASGSNTFAGPQFGGGNHGVAPGYGGYGASGGAAGGAGNAGYGSPFGGQNAMQSSTGGSAGTPGAKRNYLPGYLSGGVAAQQADATPPHAMADDRSYDSPARRTSLSSSPATRFGGGSLFGGRDGTPSKSPKFAPYTAPPRATAYRREAEEDAPPVASLNEYDGPDTSSLQVDSGMNGLRRSPSNDPNASPFATSSALPHPGSSSSANKSGYAVNIFGFPASALELILDHFAQFGEVVSSTPSTEGGNWVTVVYAQPWSAARASRKNGEILGGVLMIGVKAVDEDGLKRALAGGESGHDVVPSGASTPAPRPHSAPIGGAASTPSGVGKPVQVLGPQAAFKAAPTPTRKGFLGLGGAPSTPGGSTGDAHASLFAEKSKQAVLAQQQQQAGQKSVLGKVSDLVFGW
ncbi:uncharacterized protein JCM10292_006870 [Rhodotorula paludigena]|uniref:uncharacterized protein n=1 Tax=Rhodotorula paludigena TaxID=86838 RepID=UPI003171FB08